MKKTAIGFSGFFHYKAEEILQFTRQAEELNYDSVWIAETRFVDDGMTLLGALSSVTKKLRLGNAILGHTFARTPVLLALSAATIDVISRGRAILGLGPGATYYVSKQGLEIKQPLQVLSEYVLAIRSLLSGRETNYHGRFVHVDGVEIGVKPIQKILPIFLGVSGPKMLKLVGQIADGVVLNGLVTPEYIRKAVNLVNEAAKEAGRNPKDIEKTAVVYVSMSDDRQAALDVLKPTLADYFIHQPHTARDSGLDEPTLERIKTAWERDGQQAAAKAVPNSIVQAINVAGTKQECKAKMEEYLEAGVELPIIFPLPPDPAKIIKEFAH